MLKIYSNIILISIMNTLVGMWNSASVLFNLRPSTSPIFYSPEIEENICFNGSDYRTTGNKSNANVQTIQKHKTISTT